MIPTYENYLKENQSLTFAEMQQIHACMTAEIESDTDALELYDDFRSACVKYSAIRAKYSMLKISEKSDPEIENRRTSAHDTVIIRANKLYRLLKIIGKEASWRDKLGDESADPHIRKRIGDFACYIAFINGLSAR